MSLKTVLVGGVGGSAFLLAVGVGAAWAMGGASSIVPAVNEAVAPSPGVNVKQPLASVVQKSQSGWDFEADETKLKLKEQAYAFLTYRSGQMDELIESAYVTACREVTAQDNPFCAVVLKLDAKKEQDRRGGGRLLRRARVSNWVRAILRGKLDEFKEGTESELHQALSRITRYPALERSQNAILTAPACSIPSSVYVAFGLRLESHFPDPAFRERVVTLYERAYGCAESTAQAHAAYRLGLMRIWDGKWAEAEPLLARAMESTQTVDYRLRAAFWRYQGAIKTQNADLRSKMRDVLVKEYPLSLHGLLVSTPDLGSPPMLKQAEPEVSFRTSTDPRLNATVRAIEVLQNMGENNASFDVLETVLDNINGTEVSFRLYLALLLKRSGNAIRRFQFLATLYRENPFLITKSTLEFLYPMHQMDLVRDQSPRLDPYLVLSLIRQESAFNARARSPAGAIGLMQLLPTTARNFERVSKHQLLDPKVNVRVGVKYLSRLIKRYGFEVEMALAAYNAGPSRIDQWRKRYPVEDRLLFLDMMPVRETREYVSSIVRNYYWYVQLYDQAQLSRTLSSGVPAPAGTPAQDGAPQLTVDKTSFRILAPPSEAPAVSF